MPEKALELRRILAGSDGILIASPEYNGSVSSLLKNIIDWVSRPVAGESAAFRGKIGGILTTSPGALGGVRGLNQLRLILTYQGVIVLPEQVAVPRASEAFDSSGKITNGDLHSAVLFLGARVAKTAAAIRPVLKEFEAR